MSEFFKASTANHSLQHTQGTDLGLDIGGTNPITAATLKGHVDDTTGVHVAVGEKSTWNAKWDATVVNAASDKSALAGADKLPLIDSENSNVLKTITFTELLAILDARYVPYS